MPAILLPSDVSLLPADAVVVVVVLLGVEAVLETSAVEHAGLAAAERSLSRAAKGPGTWATPLDLWTLNEAFGLTSSFQNLEWLALAAKVRVVQFDKACSPKHQFTMDVQRLRHAILQPVRAHSSATWADWYSRSFLLCLADAEQKNHNR